MKSHGPRQIQAQGKYSLKLFCGLIGCIAVLSNVSLHEFLFTSPDRLLTDREWALESRMQRLEIQLNHTQSLLQKQVYKAHGISYDNKLDVFWLHIQKTGTSFFNTIYLNLCPRILSEHPEVLHGKLVDTRLVARFPPSEWCEATILNMPCPGCHRPYRMSRRPFTTFTMFRDPLERLQSAYAFNRHGSQLKNQNVSFDVYVNEPQVRPCHTRIAIGLMLDLLLLLNRFVGAPNQIPNCQIKMVLGHRCFKDVNIIELNLNKAIRRIKRPNFFFGVTDRWAESMCLFHQWYGGSSQPFEMRNNRPTFREPLNRTINYHDLDTELFARAVEIFDRRLIEAGCLMRRNSIEQSETIDILPSAFSKAKWG